MSLVSTDFPEDAHVVLSEVLAHLLELDARTIHEPTELARAWADVHCCDDQVLEALDPNDRWAYQDTIDRSVSPVRSSRRASGGSIVQERVVRLHLALHRRLVVLRELVPPTG